MNQPINGPPKGGVIEELPQTNENDTQTPKVNYVEVSNTQNDCGKIEKKEFYITCMSNIEEENKKIYSPSNFTFQIKEFDFCRPGWKVGLAQISFQTNFYNVTEDVPIKLTAPGYEQRFDQPINERYSESDKSDPAVLKAGFYATPESLKEALNNELNKLNNIVVRHKHERNIMPKFEYNPNNAKFTYHVGITDGSVFIYPILPQEVLDLLEMEPLHIAYGNETYQIESARPCDIQKNFHFFHVYTDLITDQNLCRHSIPLIRTIEIPSPIKFGDLITYKFDKNQIHYVDLNYEKSDNNKIKFINIELKTEDYHLVPFINAYTIVKLHFVNNLYKE